LLDLARYTDSAPHGEDVRLDLLAADVLQRRQQGAPRAATDTELRPCLVHIDPLAVTHAVENLVDNAIKWSPPARRFASASVTESCPSPITVPVSLRSMSHTSSNGSIAHPPHEECQVQVSV
jgi:signal transduction histidine kinase